jgi:outer membrane protein assembly factor BamB
MRLLLVLLLLVVFAAACPRRLGSGSPERAEPEPTPVWPLFRGDLARTGQSVAPPLVQPRIRWKTRVGIQSWLNAPALAGPRLVVGSSGDVWNKPDPKDGVYCLETRTGKILWHHPFEGDANGVAVAFGRVIATSDDGHAYALDLPTGKLLWKAKGEGKVYSHPLVFGDVVVVGDAGGNLRGLRLDSGEQRWSVKMAGPIRGGAAADQTQIYAGSQGGDVVAVRPNGEIAWRARPKRKGFDGGRVSIVAYGAPVVNDGQVIVPFARDTQYDEPALLALDATTGYERWRATGAGLWGNLRVAPAVFEGLLVFAEPYSGDVVGLQASDGRMSYRKKIGFCMFPHWAAPVATSGQVYLPRSDGVLYAVRSENGERVWRFYLGEAAKAGPDIPLPLKDLSADCAWKPPVGAPLLSSPAIAPDGTLILGSSEGWLYALEEGEGHNL